MILPLLVALTAQSVPPPAFDPPIPAGYTMYVDPSSPAATNVNNPNGTPAKPRLSLPTTLAAGTVAEVHGTANIGGNFGTIISLGTAAQPVFVKGVGAVVQGAPGASVTLAGTYLVFDGVTFDTAPVIVSGNFQVFSHCEVRHFNPTGNGAGVAVTGKLVLLKSNHIHDNGDSESPTEHDVHGVKILSPAFGVWITDSEIDHNGGDAVQVGDASSPEPWPQAIFISQSRLHEDRENALDVKQARDVVLIDCVAYGYKERDSSAGEAVVIHNQPERVWVVRDVIAASVRGVSYTGVKTLVVGLNLFLGIVHNPANVYDPESLYGSFAISGRDSSAIYLLQNTVYASDGGVSFQSGLSGDVQAYDTATSVAHHGVLGTSGSPDLKNNIWDAGTADFVGPPDNLRPAGRLVHAGIPTDLILSYAGLYHVTLSTDINGTALASPPSIGALEP